MLQVFMSFHDFLLHDYLEGNVQHPRVLKTHFYH